MPSCNPTARGCCGVLAVLLILLTGRALAHPLIEDALDVVISPGEISIEARVSLEQVQVAANLSGKPQASDPAVRDHGDYLRRHLRVEVDGEVVEATTTAAQGATYHLQYPTAHQPAVVRISQNLLADHPPWSVSCVVRFRQSNQPAFQTALLRSGETAEFGCTWTATTQPAIAAKTDVVYGSVFRAYVWHGIVHILTGYDHLLFVSALVLAARSLWDLVKVVTAFTIAHTLTLTLAVLKIVSLSEHVVEPMIAASIVFVAIQNIIAPRTSRGWIRLAVAFAFGLFHGLGFAGGLSDAMAQMPRAALWVAFGAFSLGVELGHQIVVLPLFGLLASARRVRGYGRMIRLASGCIAVAGIYYFVQALRT